MKRIKYYAAYGSNLNLKQMTRRCPDAKLVGTGYLQDYELLFKGSKSGSYLTVLPHKGSTVPVGIFKVSDQDEKNLDVYEGYPRFYKKKSANVAVISLDGKTTNYKRVFFYLMEKDRPFGLPSQGYLETCLEGYRNCHFDPEFLETALDESKRRMNNEKV